MTLTNLLLSDFSAGITNLKSDPMGLLKEANGAPVVILNRNTPAFYVVPCELFEQMMQHTPNKGDLVGGQKISSEYNVEKKEECEQ